MLGQNQLGRHLLVHLLMLGVAVRQRQGWAALGQVARLVLGVVGHVLGRLPVGNTGGSNVSMFAPMPIEPELLGVIQGDRLEAFDGSEGGAL